jgi:hypothetical protein
MRPTAPSLLPGSLSAVTRGFGGQQRGTSRRLRTCPSRCQSIHSCHRARLVGGPASVSACLDGLPALPRAGQMWPRFPAYRCAVTERSSLVTALRERADAGASAVETARWLRAQLGPAGTFVRFMTLLHHAFDIPRDTLRPLQEWMGWDPNGRLGDAEAEALMAPLRSRPADFDRASLWRRKPLPLPWVHERPFVPLSYMTSHSRLVLRSRVGDDVLDLLLIGVEAMRLHARYERLEVLEATGAVRREMEWTADVPEPYDTDRRYLRLSDGERADFVVCINVHVLHNGVPYALSASSEVADIPRRADFVAAPPLRFEKGFGVWTWTTEHDLVLRARKGATDVVFTAVRELQVRHFFDELTITEVAGHESLRRFALTDGRHEGYVVCTDLRVYRP